MEARIDKWLWAARIFKTRSIAADACKNGRVTINNVNVKPSRPVKVGEVVAVRKPPVTYSFKVLKAIEMRDLPVSLLRLVRLHSEFSGLTSQTQYLLYEFEREKYIMWLKYKNLGYKDKGKGIRICSFYKCIHPRDLSKYVDKTPHDVIKDLITIYA